MARADYRRAGVLCYMAAASWLIFKKGQNHSKKCCTKLRILRLISNTQHNLLLPSSLD